MARIKIPHHLPELKFLFPDFKGFHAGSPKIHQLKEMILGICQKLRQDQRQRFYPAREISQYFSLHHSIVLLLYSELEKEGILFRERSSGTFLQPLIAHPRNPVHGIVGLPIWSYGHCNFSDWRHFFRQMEEHLRRRHYVADFIFTRDTESFQHDFLDRLLSHKMDWLIWFLPVPNHKMILNQLQDHGVRVIVIPEPDLQFPFPSYHMSYTRGIYKGIEKWKNEGIKHIVLFTNSQDDIKRNIHHCLHLPSEMGLNCSIQNLDNDDLKVFFKHKYDPSTTAVFFHSMDISRRLSVGSLNEFLFLLSKYKVMMPGYIELESHYLKGLRADIIVANWDSLSEKIANELSAGKIFRSQAPQLFDAEYHPQADLTEFSIMY